MKLNEYLFINNTLLSSLRMKYLRKIIKMQHPTISGSRKVGEHKYKEIKYSSTDGKHEPKNKLQTLTMHKIRLSVFWR